MKEKIKHISFDLWSTLIKSNPEFKNQRAKFFHENLNPSKISFEEVVVIFRDVDWMCNAINEKTGGNIDAEEMYLMVIYQMTQTTNLPYSLEKLYNIIEEIILDLSPIIYEENIFEILSTLKQDKEVTMSILSNTAFIKGSTLRKVLKKIGLNSYFDFDIYSDEVGYSKPNKKIFQYMMDEIYHCRKEKIKHEEVLHIGDNHVADIIGGKAIGIQTLLVHSNDVSISKGLQLL